MRGHTSQLTHLISSPLKKFEIMAINNKHETSRLDDKMYTRTMEHIDLLRNLCDNQLLNDTKIDQMMLTQAEISYLILPVSFIREISE